MTTFKNSATVDFPAFQKHMICNLLFFYCVSMIAIADLSLDSDG